MDFYFGFPYDMDLIVGFLLILREMDMGRGGEDGQRACKGSQEIPWALSEIALNPKAKDRIPSHRFFSSLFIFAYPP